MQVMLANMQVRLIQTPLLECDDVVGRLVTVLKELTGHKSYHAFKHNFASAHAPTTRNEASRSLQTSASLCATHGLALAE